MIARLSLAALLILGHFSSADAQRPSRSELDLLTIPANRLPSGCRLKPADPPPTPAAQNNVVVGSTPFDSETMAATPVVSQTSSRLITRRLVLGRNVVRVSTLARSACFDAVFDYIAALPPGARR